MRILLDVNILVRANEHSRGTARKLLLALVEKRHTLLLSRDMLLELTNVLRYPRIQRLYRLSDEQIYRYVQFLQEISEIVTVDHTLPVPIRDPKDIVVLQTAVRGEADIICTLDRDFYAPATIAFCTTLGIEVCKDSELAKQIMQP